MRLTAVVRKWLVVGSLLWALPCQAAVLEPLAFTSLGTLSTTDPISINTDTLQLTGGASYTGVLQTVSGSGIFTFDDISRRTIEHCYSDSNPARLSELYAH